MSACELVEVVLISDDPEGGGFEETLLATPVDSGTYRLEEAPVTAEHPSRGDIIEAAPGKDGRLFIGRLVEKAPFRRVEWLVGRDLADSLPLTAFAERLRSAGGHFERVFGGLLILHVPTGGSFDLETERTRLVQPPPSRQEEAAHPSSPPILVHYETDRVTSRCED